MSAVQADNGRAEPVHYLLVVLRHGQSLWNAENRFTGWTDVPLTEQGRLEARRAGQALKAHGFGFDLAFTSMLERAVETLELVRQALGPPDLPTVQAWQLNERHYGCLQGLNKAETARRLGERRVIGWRRSYRGCPPALEWDDHRHPRFDPRYAHISPQALPCTESLHDTLQRMLPVWEGQVAPAIRSGRRVLIVGHGNTLRPLVKHLENIPEEAVPGIHIPTGTPIVYTINIDLISLHRYDIV
jgi:2,3-bisphosphoglycerate-dependent phosphoglycerate mutase